MTSYYLTAAINCADKCWFCVRFVFQGVSNFCSDTLFKLQNITLVIEGVYYCGATRAIASTLIITLATHLRTYNLGQNQWKTYTPPPPPQSKDGKMARFCPSRAFKVI